MSWVSRTRVFGIGDGGSSAVKHILDQALLGIDLVTVNTHAQTPALPGLTHLLIGREVTHGAGSGGNPEMGRQAAEHSAAEIGRAIAGADRVFVLCGMGGGTGTGAVPVIARLAQESGAITIGIVTTPFTFEGSQRQQIAQAGIQMLKAQIDSVVVTVNDHLLALLPDQPPLPQLFSLAARMLAWQVLVRLV
jgi:cell division protein FtsZ